MYLVETKIRHFMIFILLWPIFSQSKFDKILDFVILDTTPQVGCFTSLLSDLL